MDNYGNIHAQVGSGIWRVYNNQGSNVFNVPFNPDLPFEFNTPTAGQWGGLKIGWVTFDKWGWAGRVPAIYTDSTHLTGIAMWDRYIVPFVDGWAWNLTDNGLANAFHSNGATKQAENSGTHAYGKDTNRDPNGHDF